MEDTHSKVTTAFGRVRTASPQPSRDTGKNPPLSELVLSENIFHAQLTKERRRADRSRKPFVLMLLDAQVQSGPAIAGVIFTEVNVNGEHAIMNMLRGRTESELEQRLGQHLAANIAVSVHVFPESWDPQHSSLATDFRR